MKFFCSLGLIFVCLFTSQVWAQSLFEEAVTGQHADDSSAQEKPYELNGYLRGVFYAGDTPETHEAEMKSGYGEASLKLRVRKQDLGDGFAEIRFRRGREFEEEVSEVNLREAYVNTYVGRFDFRFGHQIVVWGRADGFNPTDNVTPKNMLIRSADEDDRREGNFLIRSFFNIQPFRIEGIWVPAYLASAVPTNLVALPPGITLSQPEYPDARLKNSALALRVNLELASFDGSLSYFDGYNPFPGLDIVMPDGVEISVVPKAYRMGVIGADFSTTVGSLGLRAELAYRNPDKDYEKHIYVPNPDLQYVIGGDKEIGDFGIILQYVGRYVFDYEDLSEPLAPEERLNYELTLKNRIISSQLNEISHAISFRPAWKLLHETLDLEVLGLYNFTTKELYLKPKASYDIADALTLTIGGELYSGPDETLFGTIESHLSAIFVELKTSF